MAKSFEALAVETFESAELLELLKGAADPEWETRIIADRLTAQFKARSRNIDSGRVPFSESPLFGGVAQGGLFD